MYLDIYIEFGPVGNGRVTAGAGRETGGKRADNRGGGRAARHACWRLLCTEMANSETRLRTVRYIQHFKDNKR